MSYIPLLYPIQTIALAGIMMAAAKYKHPLPSVQDAFKFDEIFKLHCRRNPGTSRDKFDQGHWAWKIDERINEVDLYEIIKTMNELY